VSKEVDRLPLLFSDFDRMVIGAFLDELVDDFGRNAPFDGVLDLFRINAAKAEKPTGGAF
jgi:hypothetical protein